jgi:hypothetical protein
MEPLQHGITVFLVGVVTATAGTRKGNTDTYQEFVGKNTFFIYEKKLVRTFKPRG